MAVSNPSALHIVVPDYPLDQIIGVFTGTTSIAASTGAPVTGTVTLPHGFGDSCYFQGIFSTDNGTTWNDFGAQTPNLTSPATPVLQTLDCNASSDATNVYINLINYFDFVHSSGTAYTVLYKVYLLAKNTMAHPVKPIATSQKLSFSSKFNFQQIAYKGTLPLTVAAGATGSTSVIHNLGYIPIVRAFWFNNATPTVCWPITYSPAQASAAAGTDSVQVRLTTTTLTFFSDQGGSGVGCAGSIEYRLYQ